MPVHPIRRTLFLLGMVAQIAIWATPATADSITTDVLGSLYGTVAPITYTTSAGTFTTSAITLTLDRNAQSFFTIDHTTGVITAHTVMDVCFTDGQGVKLVGVFTVNESGVLGSSPIPMEIISSSLTGAGIFAGTTAAGTNDTSFPTGIPPDKIGWVFTPKSATPLFLNLPSPTFINGLNIPIGGTITATVIPEPSSLVFIGTGVSMLILGCMRRGTLQRT